MTTYRRNNGWTAHVHWRDPNGKPRQLKRNGFRTKREAEDFETKTLAEVLAGRAPVRGRLTVADYLTQRWLPAVRPRLKASTFATYSDMVRAYILPRLGGVALTALDPARLEAFYSELAVDGRTGASGRTGGLSPKAVRNVAGVISKALADAERWGLVGRNVARVATPPSGRPPEMQCWTPAQLAAFVAVAAEQRLGGLWVLAATSGMRRGELLGLRWSDIDLDEARLAVRSTRVRAGDAIIETDPKTERSRRTLALDAGTVAALRGLRRLQQEEALALGTGWTDDVLVAVDEIGEPIHPRRWSRSFTVLAAQAGLPRIRLHDLRHTVVTAALTAGVPVEVVSRRVGHADVVITLRVYRHVLEGEDAAAAEALGALVFAPAAYHSRTTSPQSTS
jgi:integrase